MEAVKEIIQQARKQIAVVIVGGILSAFTINLIFIFSINNTIEELRRYRNENKKNTETLNNKILEIYKYLK